MNTGNHAAVLLSHVLAPGPAKTHAVSLTHYALESWTPGGILVLVGVIAVAVYVVSKIFADD